MILLAGALAFAGCGKSNSDEQRAQEIPALMALPKFQHAFPSPTPQQQGDFSEAYRFVRYSQYPKALAALDKLASDPGLTEPQKKAISDLIEAVKQTMAKAPAPPVQ